ncbi:response regulator [Pseudoalteromonas citrea]|uniref:Response regulator n=1 Tax=Pseudoalteromonas citrea TaxID=43655 RepID=A0A5S3XKA6_9GAMM|nr:response regulator [Pseudoalteromonas citrea]TMP43667.1 response regulator [Pseudoalteromonas citrea]TMP53478.1 response regulator [Pseudoalteromonas citrea]
MSFSILVCDDSRVARKQVVRCLSSALDAEITQAENGVQALEVLEGKQIDLLCLDLTMPEMDGIGVLEAIKAKKIETFVVVISADIQPEMKERVIRLGAIDFIEKPVTPQYLLNLLTQYGIR